VPLQNKNITDPKLLNSSLDLAYFNNNKNSQSKALLIADKSLKKCICVIFGLIVLNRKRFYL